MNSTSADVPSKWIREVPQDRQPVCVDTKYFKLSSAFEIETFEQALTYKPKKGDVFVTTYPKNGTTWMQQIVYLIQHDAIPPETFEDLYANSVFLEMFGLQGLQSMEPPGSIKIHLAAELAPDSDDAKYIVVVRNPKDACTSYYHHTRGLDKFYQFKGDLNDFFDLFIGGQVEFGDYFHFINSWLTKKDQPNVMFITYEFMKKKPADAIRKVAYFMDEKYGHRVDTDQKYLRDILHHSSVSEMKRRYRYFSGGTSTGFSLVRKGQVNDWKGQLTREQSESISQRFKEEAEKNPLLTTVWDDYSWLDDDSSK